MELNSKLVALNIDIIHIYCIFLDDLSDSERPVEKHKQKTNAGWYMYFGSHSNQINVFIM